MSIILALAFVMMPLHAAQAQDTTQTALLRYQLQDQLRQELKATQEQWRKDFDNFKRDVRQENVQSIETAKQALRSSINTYLVIGSVSVAIIAFVLTFLGYDRIKSFITNTTAKFDKQINEAIFRIDPHDMPIKLPATGMEKQVERLKRLDFHQLSTYQWLDHTCTRHAVVVLATEDAQAEELKNHIMAKNLAESEDVVFVVYTKGARINPTILSKFDNVTYANNHLTLVQALFVAARGMVR